MKMDQSEIGIKGYAMPPEALKSRVLAYGIPKGKAYGGMLDSILRSKKLVPSPSQYKIKNDILPVRKNIYSLADKSPRRTIMMEIEY